MRPLALDLFCKAGGASMGLYRAGFDVIGAYGEFIGRAAMAEISYMREAAE